MDKLQYQYYYKRNLPHYQPPGSTIFITFRLANSIPLELHQQFILEEKRIWEKIGKIEEEKERSLQADWARRHMYAKWDNYLDSGMTGPKWLKDPMIAEMVAHTMQDLQGTVYDLLTFTIMPNHVHLVCTPLEKTDGSCYPISQILKTIKGQSACSANRYLARAGSFWQHESYDHIIRDEKERDRVILYVMNNPVKAGLVEKSEDWLWSYVSDRL